MPSKDDREEFLRARHELWLAVVRALRLEQIVDWLDRQLRRWPWLYKKLA